MLGSLPPFLHAQHGGVFHAVVEHLPPQSAWRPLAVSPSHPSPALAPCPASQVTGSPVTPVWRTAVQAPRAHRYGRWAEAVQRAPGLRVLGWLPQWACQLPFPPALPFSPVLLPELPGLSAGSLCHPLSQRFSLLTLQHSFL